MKTCCIVVYFGALPDYFKVFLKGAEHNPIVHYLILTDDTKPHNTSTNVSILPLFPSDFKELCLKKLDIEIPDNLPGYKLCDYRPAYGLIFQEYLDDYDYWGYCDLDLIPSNLTPVQSEIFGQYDIINTSTRWMHGPMCFYRNDPFINTLFKESADWKTIFESSKHYAFDENGGKKGLFDGAYKKSSYGSFLDLPSSYYTIDSDVVCMSTLVYKHKEQLKIYSLHLIKDALSKHEHVVFDKGTITDGSPHVWWAYHWVIEKKLNSFWYPKWQLVPDKFQISIHGFLDWQKGNGIKSILSRIIHRIKGTVADFRDLFYLLRTDQFNAYYYDRYAKTNLRLMKFLLFLTSLFRGKKYI